MTLVPSPVRRIGCVLLCWLALSAPAYAADEEPDPTPSKPDDDGVYFVPPLFVRTTRGSRELREDRAAAGAVVLPEDFGDAGDTMAEVLDRAAGVRVTRLGGPAAFSTLSIRGSTADQVMVVLDGVPLNTAGGGPFDLSRLPLGQLGRIEIYRGASPLTLGSSAIGGVLSINTRATRERELSVSAGGGSFGAREARVYYAEPFATWEFGIGLDYTGWEGDFPYLNDQGTRFFPDDDHVERRRNNDFNQINMLGTARARIGEHWTLSFTEWLFWRRQGVPGLGQFQTREASYETLDSLTALLADGRDLAGQVDWRIQGAFHYTRSSFLDPLSEIGLANGDGGDRTLAPSLSSSAVWRPLPWWDLTSALSYRYEHLTPSAQRPAAAESDRHTLTAGLESGFYIDALNLLILPSGRLQWFASRLTTPPLEADAAGPIADASESQWSWRAALVFTGIKDTKVTVSGGRAVRLPSLFELFGNSGRVLGNPALRAEAAYNVDCGIIYDSSMLPDPYRLRLELFGFYSDVTDLIQFVQNAQGTARSENLDHARMVGIEAGLRADLFGHLRLQGNYTWLRTRNAGEIAARKSRRLPLRPAGQWYARAEGYLSEIPWIADLAAFLEAEWVAGNFLDNANLVAVGSRFFLNTGLSVKLDFLETRVSFTARNLTNERTADLVGYPLPGRSYHVRWTMRVL